MKSISAALILIASLASFAGAAETRKGSNRVVLTLKGPPENAGDWKKKLGADYVGRPRAPERLTARERDEMFLSAGFSNAELQSLDQMERDLLVRNLKFGSLDFAKKKYERFGEAKLLALRKLAIENRKLAWGSQK